jgi:hypothetical protein
MWVLWGLRSQGEPRLANSCDLVWCAGQLKSLVKDIGTTLGHDASLLDGTLGTQQQAGEVVSKLDTPVKGRIAAQAAAYLSGLPGAGPIGGSSGSDVAYPGDIAVPAVRSGQAQPEVAAHVAVKSDTSTCSLPQATQSDVGTHSTPRCTSRTARRTKGRLSEERAATPQELTDSEWAEQLFAARTCVCGRL